MLLGWEGATIARARSADRPTPCYPKLSCVFCGPTLRSGDVGARSQVTIRRRPQSAPRRAARAWATPLDVVAAVVGEVAKAPVVDFRRIVAGEQNEVYDVTLEQGPSLIVRIS